MISKYSRFFFVVCRVFLEGFFIFLWVLLVSLSGVMNAGYEAVFFRVVVFVVA